MATKKPTAKKTTAKKSVTRKPAPWATAKKTSAGIATRRPDQNLPPTANMVNSLTEDVLSIIAEIDNYAANLRALYRKRHNGVGIRRLGFIEAALRLSTKFPQYFPHWLTTAAQKPSAFGLRSLRIAQTPHIYSWSFAKGKTPKLSGAVG